MDGSKKSLIKSRKGDDTSDSKKAFMFHEPPPSEEAREHDGVAGGGILMNVSHKNLQLPPPMQEPEGAHLLTGQDVNKFPGSIKYIMVNEICERFSYYGLRAILALYLTDQLLFSENVATEIVHGFTMAAYGITVLGGYISDAVLGKYRTILYFSLIYCFGGLVLSASAAKELHLNVQKIGMGCGLALIALGTGGIKPVISAFVGDQFTPAQAHLLERVFRLFYFCINLGSVGSTILTPIIRTAFNYMFAFGLPAVLLLVATTIFFSGRKQYRTHSPQGSVLKDAARMVAYAIKARVKYGRNSLPRGQSFLYLAEGPFSRTLIQDVATAFRVLMVFVPIPFFWSLFDQHASRWIFQAKDMDREIFGITIDADQVPALDPILVLILVPIFDQVIYPLIAKIRPFRPLPRMAFGMLLTSASFVVAALLQILIDQQGVGEVHIVMQVPQYVLLASGEIMVSITGLEFAYTQAPRSMKSIIMSGWLITVAIGNLLVVVVAEMVDAEMWIQFFFFAALMLVAMVLFMVIAYYYKNTQERSEEH